ncbi:MAG: hypothetical protein ABIE22_03930 [archaeon]
MKQKVSKKELLKLIDLARTEKDFKKIKRIAMHSNIKLKELRRKFCKKCFSPKLKVKSVKKGFKRVVCENCGYIARYRIKTS